MKPSKLEIYIGILKTIDQQRLPQLATIQDKTNVSIDYLRERVAFLVYRGLVEQKTSGDQVAYKNTRRGMSVLKYFEEHQQRKSKRSWVSA